MSGSSRIKLLATLASVARETSRPGAAGLAERAHSVPRLVRATLEGSYHGTSRRRLGGLALGVAYVISPVDLVPEPILPVLGAIDDALVTSWVLRLLVDETDRYLAWERGQGIRPPPPQAAGGVHADGGAAMRAALHSLRAVLPTTPAGGRSAAVGEDPMGHLPRDRRLGSGALGPVGPVRTAASAFLLESMRKRLER